MNTWAIGDIHGSYTELMELYGKMQKEGFDPKEDKLIFLGDYVDGGKRVKEVVDQLIEWNKEYPHWIFLKGNHESMMLDSVLGQCKK